MPSKPLKPCNKIGCSNLTRDKYCEDHIHVADSERKEMHRHYDKYQRDKQAASFYNSVAWRRVRQAAIMRDHGLCQECIKYKRVTTATEVDHIIPIKVDWSLRLTLSNLQSLCHSCHMQKTQNDKQRYGERV